jgi:hypothetical protein
MQAVHIVSRNPAFRSRSTCATHHLGDRTLRVVAEPLRRGKYGQFFSLRAMKKPTSRDRAEPNPGSGIQDQGFGIGDSGSAIRDQGFTAHATE